MLVVVSERQERFPAAERDAHAPAQVRLSRKPAGDRVFHTTERHLRTV
jgi:hypothetical protein